MIAQYGDDAERCLKFAKGFGCVDRIDVAGAERAAGVIVAKQNDEVAALGVGGGDDLLYALARFMPRVLELFAKRNLVPERWHSDVVPSRASGQVDVLSIDIQVAGLNVQTGEYIARCLRRVWGVDAVLMSQKGV